MTVETKDLNQDWFDTDAEFQTNAVAAVKLPCYTRVHLASEHSLLGDVAFNVDRGGVSNSEADMQRRAAGRSIINERRRQCSNAERRNLSLYEERECSGCVMTFRTSLYRSVTIGQNREVTEEANREVDGAAHTNQKRRESRGRD